MHTETLPLIPPPPPALAMERAAPCPLDMRMAAEAPAPAPQPDGLAFGGATAGLIEYLSWFRQIG